jgi:peptidoglycan DL-endopeptidase CwlO
MSLGELVAETGQALRDARGLYGPVPADGAWSSTGQLATGREGVASAGQAATAGWGGVGATTYGGANGGQLWALDSTMAADNGTAPPVTGSGQAASDGGEAMNGVIDDTQAGVAAIAPSTGTAAGKQTLVTHLQGQLDRAKALLQVSRQRSAELAALIASSSRGYGAGMGAPPMSGMGMMPGAPMGMGMGGGGLPVPSIGALTALARGSHGHARASFDFRNPDIAGRSQAAQTAVKAALTRLGCPYVWGAKGPDQFDCSGLTRWAYAQAGVTLGDDTYAQINQGSPVAHGEVQAGDLIFPNTGHVMLAISPTETVEAEQSGVPIKISPMPGSYLARRPTP